MAYEQVSRFAQCVSENEKSQRFGVTAVNVIAWLGLVIFFVASMGGLLLFILPALLIRYLLAEYSVRQLQALGATVSPTQFPEVHQAAEDVARRMGVPELPRIIVIGSGEVNAFAIKIARKKVVVILSDLLAATIDDPAKLRYLLAHEMCHHALDHGWRGTFEIYKPAKYRQARELTCDVGGLVAANDLESAKATLRMFAVGRHLHGRVNDEALIAEARHIYSGFSGWLVRQYLSHPPAGSRLENMNTFHARAGAPQPSSSALALE